MQHSELAEWRLFSLLPPDEQSAFYTSSVFIWLCFFQRKFCWDWLQFNFILIMQPRWEKWRKSRDISIQASTIDCMLILPKTCKWMCCHYFDMAGLCLNVWLKDTSEKMTGMEPMSSCLIHFCNEWVKVIKKNAESSEVQWSKDWLLKWFISKLLIYLWPCVLWWTEFARN